MPAAASSSLAIQVAVLAVALLASRDLSIAGTAADTECPCPVSIGAEAGSKPLVVVRDEANKPLFEACGYLESEPGVKPVIGSEFEVFRCGGEKSLLSFGALQTCVLTVETGRLVVTETEKWPFGPAWKWIDVPVWEYVVGSDLSDTVSKTMILKPRSLTQREVGDALDYYAKRANREEVSEDYEEAIGRILAASLAGNDAAQRALGEMGATMRLDGDGAEVHQKAIALYQNYAKETHRVPVLEGR